MARSKIDTGRGRRKPSRKDLDSWKKDRGRRLNEEARYRRRRRRKVISTKRKKRASNRICPTCGEYHFRKSKCSEQFRDAKIDLMVRQIYFKADSINANMQTVWSKLDDLESTYQSMLLKVHRLQSNRVCLGSLTGLNYPGENHPKDCPCTKQKEKERLDQIKKEERQKQVQEEQRKQKEKRERERRKREELIESRKKRFYQRMEQQQQQQKKMAPSAEEEQIEEEGPTDDKGEAVRRASIKPSSVFTSMSSEGSSFESNKTRSSTSNISGKSFTDVTRLDEASSRRRSRKKSMMYEKPLDIPGLSYIVMDGSIKSLKTEFSEEGGKVVESVVIEPVELVPKILEEEKKEVKKPSTREKDQQQPQKTVLEVTKKKKPSSPQPPSVPFGDFLDMMEVF